jgi:hypothetical protein
LSASRAAILIEIFVVFLTHKFWGRNDLCHICHSSQSFSHPVQMKKCLMKEMCLLQVYGTDPKNFTTQYREMLQKENEKAKKHENDENL